MNCYEITVETTNSSGDSFCLPDGRYDACIKEGYCRGTVYVLAVDISAAAKMIGSAALEIKLMGKAYAE